MNKLTTWAIKTGQRLTATIHKYQMRYRRAQVRQILVRDDLCGTVFDNLALSHNIEIGIFGNALAYPLNKELLSRDAVDHGKRVGSPRATGLKGSEPA